MKMQGRCSDIRGSQGPLPAGYEASEGIAVTVLLTLAGGLQDAYSYFARGHVFANAQTGNIVLLAAALLEGDWSRAFSYIIPLLSFAGGIYAALEIRRLYRGAGRIHWRQIVAFCEILLLAAVGCMGEGHSQIANAMASFSCAMQVRRNAFLQAFPSFSFLPLDRRRRRNGPSPRVPPRRRNIPSSGYRPQPGKGRRARCRPLLSPGRKKEGRRSRRLGKGATPRFPRGRSPRGRPST